MKKTLLFWAVVGIGTAALAAMSVVIPRHIGSAGQSQVPRDGRYELIRGEWTHVRGHYEKDPAPGRTARVKFIPD